MRMHRGLRGSGLLIPIGLADAGVNIDWHGSLEVKRNRRVSSFLPSEKAASQGIDERKSLGL